MGPPQRVMWHCDLKGLPPSVNHDKKARSWWIWWAHSIQCKRTRVRYTLSFPVRGAWKDPCTVANNTLCNGLVPAFLRYQLGWPAAHLQNRPQSIRNLKYSPTVDSTPTSKKLLANDNGLISCIFIGTNHFNLSPVRAINRLLFSKARHVPQLYCTPHVRKLLI